MPRHDDRTHLAGEMDKLRFWQEAALRAMEAFIIANPLRTFDETNGIGQYTRRASKFAFEMAEQMHKNHGPSVAPEFNNR